MYLFHFFLVNGPATCYMNHKKNEHKTLKKEIFFTLQDEYALRSHTLAHQAASVRKFIAFTLF